MPFSRQSGQVLLLSILLVSILLISLVVVFSFNQLSTLHLRSSTQGAQGQSVADAGIAYAIQQLSASSTTWSNALIGSYTGTACNTGDNISSPTRNYHYRLFCSTSTALYTDLQPYQVAVTAVMMSTTVAGGSDIPLRATRAYLSQRTLGLDSASGLHAAAAVQLVRRPDIQGSGVLNVHWGPLFCMNLEFDPEMSWTLMEPLDSQRYPRKFSVGGIFGTTYSRSGLSLNAGPMTDQQEYWAYLPQTAGPLIDEVSYKTAATQTTGVTSPVSRLTGAAIAPTNCLVANCGYFQPAPGDTAVFSSNYSLTGGTLFVNGSAEFSDVTLDNVNVVITGALEVTGAAHGTQPTLRVPWSADAEYPYAIASWPCFGQATCSYINVFPGDVQFRGFLYVKGFMTVSNSTSWKLSGALWVGDPLARLGSSGRLIVYSGSTLTVAYDDRINHAILVNPLTGTVIKLVPDKLLDVPARLIN